MNTWTLYGIGFALVMLVCYPLFLHLKQIPGKRAVATTIKGIGTGIAACLALYGALLQPDAAAWWVVAALVVCTAADVVISFHFILGMATFLVGHVLYLAAYLSMATLLPASIGVCALLYVIVLIAFRPAFPVMGERKVPYFIYAAVLLMMLAVAASLPHRLGLRGWAAAIGAVLFVFSDLVLAVGEIKGQTRRKDRLCMGTYYPAQLVLALVALQPWLLI